MDHGIDVRESRAASRSIGHIQFLTSRPRDVHGDYIPSLGQSVCDRDADTPRGTSEQYSTLL